MITTKRRWRSKVVNTSLDEGDVLQFGTTLGHVERWTNTVHQLSFLVETVSEKESMLQWTRSSTVWSEYERSACCMTDWYESAITNTSARSRLTQKNHREVLIPQQHVFSCTKVGDKTENRERRRRERENLTFLFISALILGLILGKLRVKNGEKLKFLLKFLCYEIGVPYI